MLPGNLVHPVTHGPEENIVGPLHMAIEGKLDDCLGPLDRLQLALEVGVSEFLLGDIGGILHHLEGTSVGIQNRIVAGLDPHFPPTFAEAFVLGGLIPAGPELAPELMVLGAVGGGLIDEHAMVFTPDLLQPVTHRVEEGVVGDQDRAVEVELDDRLGLVDGLDLSPEVGQVLRADFDHPLRHSFGDRRWGPGIPAVAASHWCSR